MSERDSASSVKKYSKSQQNKNSRVKNGSEPTITATATPTKIAMSTCYLPYQYRRDVKIPSTSVLTSTDLRPARLGLGSAAGNLRTSHIINSKKDSLVNSCNTKRVFVRGSSSVQSQPEVKNDCTIQNKAFLKMTPGGNSGASITSRMKMLTIYESPKQADLLAAAATTTTPVEEGKTSCRINPAGSVTGKVFLTLNKKANYLGGLNRKVTFSLGGRASFNVNPNPIRKTNSDKDKDGRDIANLCRHFRNILGWKLSIHLSWKYAEAKIKSWYSPTEPPIRMTLKEVGELLKVSEDNMRNFEFDPELEQVFTLLKKNLCHVNFPNIAKLLALQKIQQGKSVLAAKYLAEHCGMYLHSEIVDKHLTFIRRNEEMKSESNCDTAEDLIKTKFFWEQVNETLRFSNDCFGKFGDKEFRKCSSFNPDWNIVQISTSVLCANRFGYDLVDKQNATQLLLSAFGFLPGETVVRNEFTTFCAEPRIEPGSQMRYGLTEAFQKLLDNNLTISDDKIIISRKKYWEERGKHNDAIEAIMYAMEDWLFPWTFMLAGTIKDKTAQERISSEVLSHPLLKKCSDSQKFVIYRLTEGYNILPVRSRNVVDSLVAFITGEVDEDLVQSLTKKIFDVGSCISPVEPRNPTILVIDQEIDILPWDWLPCLRTTDVTRMPSLNLIRSTQMLTKFVGGNTAIRSINKDKCTFVLNPDGSLPQVQARLEKYFTDRDTWTPVIGRSPTTQEMQNSLENQDIFLYCGHGAGSNFYPEYAVQKLVCRAIPILMGCSSAQSHFSGPGLYAYSSVHAYFTAGCTSVVGFLWEVTDTECDRITAEFIERWLPHPSAKLPKMPLFDSESKREHDANLSSAMKKSRTAATQLLTQAAAVCYGLPIVKIY